VVTGAAGRRSAKAGAEVAAAVGQLAAQLEAERAALAGPARAEAVVAELTAARERVRTLVTDTAQWRQTLDDGIADLAEDVEHDLRTRVRRVVEEADESLEGVDPADIWAEMRAWLESRASRELLANFVLLRSRAEELSEQVARHFSEVSDAAFDHLRVTDPGNRLPEPVPGVPAEEMGVRTQAMVALKGASYGGALTFASFYGLASVALAPLTVGIGLIMGGKVLRDEKKRQVVRRREQARAAVRRYCDEVSYVMGKDSRDTLRRIQRELRERYGVLAEELNRSSTEALRAASSAAQRGAAERGQRLADLDAELEQIRQLRESAREVPA
jgi:hypothetical protein